MAKSELQEGRLGQSSGSASKKKMNSREIGNGTGGGGEKVLRYVLY